MKTATVIVERGNDGNFWCRVKLGDTLLTSEGATVTDAKKDFMDCYEEAKADADENGQNLQNVTFKYEYDLQAFFDYFNFLNMNEIARRANINPSLLRQYNAGIKRAGEKTYSRLAACLNEIRTELNSASLLQS